jgi:hypothetical protein
MSVALMHNGSVVGTPLDASLRPLVKIEALISANGVTESANPGGWPLTEEELDAPAPPADGPDLPQWQRQAMTDVARDDLGQPLTTRIAAADGGWADVLMTTAGDPLRFAVDLRDVISEAPDDGPTSVTLMRGRSGLTLAVVDAQGRPATSRPRTPE